MCYPLPLHVFALIPHLIPRIPHFMPLISFPSRLSPPAGSGSNVQQPATTIHTPIGDGDGDGDADVVIAILTNTSEA